MLVKETDETYKDDVIFIIQAQFKKVRNAKKASMLIKEYGVDLEVIGKEFAEIEHIIINESVNFFMQLFEVSFKHYSMENVLRLADFLADLGDQKYFKPLAYFIARLHAHSNLDEAKHIYQQYEKYLESHLSKVIIEDIEKTEIELEIEEIRDGFEPLTTSSKALMYLSLPPSVEFLLVDSEDSLSRFKLLVSENAGEPLGIDTEWRPPLNIFHKIQGPSILQLSGSNMAFVIDLLALKSSSELCEILQFVFTQHPIIGFGFQTDILQINQFIMQSQEFSTLAPAFKLITRFIDLQDVFQDYLKIANPPRLQTIVEEGFTRFNCFNHCFSERPQKVTMCKQEQMSNWERRPLRKSQLHYAALDAWVLN